MAFNYGYPPFANYSPVQAFQPQPTIYPPAPQTLQSQPQNSQQSGLSAASRLVTNKEEANAVSADFSGAVMVFPDLTNNRVYIKRWDYQSGSAVFMEFAPVGEGKPAPAYVTREEFDSLWAEIERMKKGKVKANEADDE